MTATPVQSRRPLTPSAKAMFDPPPYSITSNMPPRVAEATGHAEAARVAHDLRLRRINRIRMIQGSLAIGGRVLSQHQISTILHGKPVVAPLRNVQEARNAIAASDGHMGRLWQTQLLPSWKPLFDHLPVNGVTHAHQSRYYHAIPQSSADRQNASFVALMLKMILEALRPPLVLPR